MKSHLPRTRARQVLDDAVKQCRNNNLTDLPTVRSMAAHADVSVFTMTKVIHEAVEKGSIETIPGKGIRIHGEKTEKPGMLTRRRSVWEMVKDRIHRDITQGVFQPGQPLPSYKELQTRYGVSYSSIKKALSLLSKQIGLEHGNRRYRIPRHKARPGSTILIFLPVRDGNWLFYSPRIHQVLQSIERCALQYHMTAVFLPCSSGNLGDGLHEVKKRIEQYEKGSTTIIGSMIWGNRMPMLHELLAYLESKALPVTLLDDAGDLPHEVTALSTRHCRMFLLGADPRSAETVAQFLLRNGHRRIAALTLSDRYAWSRTRYNKLHGTFAALGPKYGVDCFSIDSLVEQKNQGIGRFEEYYQILASARELGALLNRFTSRRILGDRLKRTVHRVHHAFQYLLTSDRYARCLYGLFERILSDTRYSACVVFSDVIAAPFVDYCTRRKVQSRDTRAFAVVSFDNSEPVSVAGITSYEFNVEGTVRAMFDYIVHPGYTRIARPMQHVAIEGILVERQTDFRV